METIGLGCARKSRVFKFSSTVETELRWIYAAFADRSIHPVLSPGGLATSLQLARRDGLVQALGWQGRVDGLCHSDGDCVINLAFESMP